MWIGSIGPIPVGYDDDPRDEDIRRIHHDANVIAQALHSADELLGGLSHDNEWVRYETIPRLTRWGSDPRVQERLLQLVVSDDSAAVRDRAIMELLHFEPRLESIEAIRSQSNHPDPDVRESVNYVLTQWTFTDPRSGQP
jgi:hypothetical protein